MSALDREILAERTSAVERHLRRVAEKLPTWPEGLTPASDATDAVILHLWQAVQIVLDVALGACAAFHLGAPGSYGDAFRRLASARVIDPPLADRLVRAAGFRNFVAHAYESIDLARVHEAASNGPPDLRRFLAAMRDALPEG